MSYKGRLRDLRNMSFFYCNLYIDIRIYTAYIALFFREWLFVFPEDTISWV